MQSAILQALQCLPYGDLSFSISQTSDSCHVCRSEAEGRFLYIFKDALSEYSGQAGAGQEKRPVPPCISQSSHDTVQVIIEVSPSAPVALASQKCPEDQSVILVIFLTMICLLFMCKC